MTHYTTHIDFKFHFEDRVVELGPREAITVPSGVRHRPRAPQRTVVIMVEADGEVPTGD